MHRAARIGGGEHGAARRVEDAVHDEGGALQAHDPLRVLQAKQVRVVEGFVETDGLKAFASLNIGILKLLLNNKMNDHVT